jgi:hypothetical protein
MGRNWCQFSFSLPAQLAHRVSAREEFGEEFGGE